MKCTVQNLYLNFLVKIIVKWRVTHLWESFWKHGLLLIPRDVEGPHGSDETRDLRGVSFAACLSGALCSTISERHIGCCKRAGKLGDLFCSIIFSRPHITPEWTRPNRSPLRKDSNRLLGLNASISISNKSNFLRIQSSYIETEKVGTFREFECFAEVYLFTVHCWKIEDNLHHFCGIHHRLDRWIDSERMNNVIYAVVYRLKLIVQKG